MVVELTLKMFMGAENLPRTLIPREFVLLSLWQLYDHLKRVQMYLAHSFRGLVHGHFVPLLWVRGEAGHHSREHVVE